MMTEVAGGDSRMNSYSKLFVADDQLNEQSVKDDDSYMYASCVLRYNIAGDER